MSAEEHTLDRQCSIEVESNFKGEVALRVKWYFEPTLQSAWEAIDAIAKVRAALKLQYLTANDEEIERALQLVRDVNGEESLTRRVGDWLAEQVEKSKRGAK